MKILFKNARILTLKNREVLIGDLLVENEKIIKIDVKINDQADKIINCYGNILMPGFKNAHAHSGMTFLRSCADDLPLDKWLKDCVFPMEKQLKKNDIYHLTKLAFLEYLTSGITACFDMYFKNDEVKKASIDIGMKTVILVQPETPETKIEDVKKRLITFKKIKNKNNLVTAVLGFHSEYTLTEKMISEIAKLAHELKTSVFTHCSETKKEVDECIVRHGVTPVIYFNKFDLFRYGGGIFHGVYLSDEEIKLLSKKKIFVCTCPCSNLKLASGIAPIKKMFYSGVKIAIGTDGPASNNGLDMFREIYLTSVLSKFKENDPASIDAFEILKMATINSALMIGLEKSTFLEKGNFADIIMINIHKPDMQPINNIIKNIVYSGNKLDVEMTMINGKILYYKNKFYLKENINNIYKNAQIIANRFYIKKNINDISKKHDLNCLIKN